MIVITVSIILSWLFSAACGQAIQTRSLLRMFRWSGSDEPDNNNNNNNNIHDDNNAAATYNNTSNDSSSTTTTTNNNNANRNTNNRRAVVDGDQAAGARAALAACDADLGSQGFLGAPYLGPPPV